MWAHRRVWLQVANIVPKFRLMSVTDRDNLVVNLAFRDSQAVETILVLMMALPVPYGSSKSLGG